MFKVNLFWIRTGMTQGRQKLGMKWWSLWSQHRPWVPTSNKELILICFAGGGHKRLLDPTTSPFLGWVKGASLGRVSGGVGWSVLLFILWLSLFLPTSCERSQVDRLLYTWLNGSGGTWICSWEQKIHLKIGIRYSAINYNNLSMASPCLRLLGFLQ